MEGGCLLRGRGDQKCVPSRIRVAWRPPARITYALAESYVTGPANIRGGGQDVGRASSCADSGSGPRGRDEERRN